MDMRRSFAAALALGCGTLVLGGCNVSQTYGARCSTSPPVPHQDPGAISMDADAPARVAPGETFTLTVNSIGVQGGAPGPSLPEAHRATFYVTGAVSPSGNMSVGSISSLAEWPHEVELTATGQPGETIEIGVVSASRTEGTFPNLSSITCDVGDGEPLVTLEIAAPASADVALPADGLEGGGVVAMDDDGGFDEGDPVPPGDDDGGFGEGDPVPPVDDDGGLGEGDGPLGGGGGGVFDGDPVPRQS